VNLFHGRWRRRVSRLAAGVLTDDAARRVRAHLEGCHACRAELSGLQATLDLIARDPVRGAEPGIPLSAMRTRVVARLDSPAEPRAASAQERAGWALGAAAAALLAVMALRPGTPLAPPAAGPSPAADVVVTSEVPDAFLLRMERTAAREQAARYLGEAGDVLVTVAARPHRCRKGEERVDVGEEAQRSRELLARGRLIDMDAAAVASARPVLDDVEQMLREVASLESCARKHDLQTITRQVERSRLLLKIDLMTRELQG
jgi:hypothetical protein